MKQVIINNIPYYLTKQEGINILFSLKEFNEARTRASKYSLELNTKKWWNIW